MSIDLMSPERLARGYVIVLPGIEGRSLLNRSIVRGLVSGGVPYGIEIHDWTYGPLLYFWNLRDSRRHREQSDVIAGKIVRYRQSHPDRPVVLIGHSGGGAMTLFALERLPPDVRVTAGVMLVPAISPSYDLRPALANTARGLWNFCSWADLLFIGLGTLLCGTCDEKHRLSAGMTGFSSAAYAAHRSGDGEQPALHQVRYHAAMLCDANLGGHFGPVNPCFVRRWIAPIVMGDDSPR